MHRHWLLWQRHRLRSLRTLTTWLSSAESWEILTHHLTLQTITLSSRRADSLFWWNVVPCCLPLRSALSSFDALPSLWICCQVREKTFRNPIWASRASGLRHICRSLILITFQTTSKCGLDPIWKISHFMCFCFFLLCRLNLDVPKTDLGWQSEHPNTPVIQY